MLTRPINRKQTLAKITIVVFILSMVAMVATNSPTEKAAIIHVDPTKGPPGTFVTIEGGGYTGAVTVSLGGSPMMVVGADSGGYIIAQLDIPDDSTPGSKVFTATDASGDTSFIDFTVTVVVTPSPSPSPSPTRTFNPTTTTPFTSPTPNSSQGQSGFLSNTELIGIVVVVAVVAIIAFMLMQRRGGKRQRLAAKEPLPYQQPYQPEPSLPSNAPPQQRYGQQANYQSGGYQQRSYGSSGQRYSGANRYRSPPPSYGAGAGYGQQASGRRCSGCGRTVGADYNTCPYCNTRLR